MFFLLFALRARSLLNANKCTTGLKYARFSTEFFSGSVSDNFTIPFINLSHLTYEYNSIEITGSFCPKTRGGNYSFHLSGRPYAQMIVNGISEPSTLGPGGNCWPTTSTNARIYTVLNEHECYGLTVYMRTGCNLYDQNLILNVSKDGGEPYFPTDEFKDCIINDCESGYYGEKCENKCQIQCVHGKCFDGRTGNGKCICDDGFSGEDCSNIGTIIPPDGSQGASFTIYSDEIGFTKPMSETNISKIGVDSFPENYKSAIIRGSIIVEESGEYQFKILGKPYAQFNFENSSTPYHLGPAGSCLDSIITDEDSPIFYLNRHTTYPYEISFRSGCALIKNRHINLQWKNGPKWGSVDVATWENFPPELSFMTTNKNCVPTTYGEDCENSCDPCGDETVCNDSFTGDGVCVCKSDSTRCFCSPDQKCANNGTCMNNSCSCLPNYYGDHCELFCSAAKTCSGYGTCSEEGKCICHTGHTGINCKGKCTRKDTCNSHGECIENGICVCDKGYSGNTCARHNYQPEPNEAPKGIKLDIYHDEFFDGTPSTEILETMKKDFGKVIYKSAIATGSLVSYNKTIVEVKIDAKPIGEIRLNKEWKPSSFGAAGSCLPSIVTEEYIAKFTLWPNRLYPIRLAYRSGCSLYSQHLNLKWRVDGTDEWVDIPKENLRAASPDQMCLERYFDEFCTSYCDLDCNMQGNCIIENRKAMCKCLDGYYGESCQYYCDAKVNCSGHGRCDGNRCICDIHHYGNHCEHSCSRKETCSNHGSCTADGKCKCDENYEGETCAQHIHVDSPNDDQPGVTLTEYYSERFTGKPTRGPEIVSNCTSNFTYLFFKGVTFNGTIIPKVKSSGRLRMTAKPYGQMYFGGKAYPRDIGASFSCWGTIYTVEETDIIDFIPNKVYPLSIAYKSGCSFCDQYISIEWKTGSMSDWSAIPTDLFVTPAGGKDQVCAKRYFGANCELFCDLNCSMNGECIIASENGGKKQTQKCSCFKGFKGSHCEEIDDSDDDDDSGDGKNHFHLSTAYWLLIGGVVTVVVALVIVVVVVVRRRKKKVVDPTIQFSSIPLLEGGSQRE